MKLNFFDSHTHLQFDAYKKDRKQILKECFRKGVGMINVGTTKTTSLKAQKLANKHSEKHIYSTVGIHPTKVTSDYTDSQELEDKKSNDNEWDYDFFEKLTDNEKVVGIGECGLDYFRLEKGDKVSEKSQKKLFKKHIKLSRDKDLPLMIHCRPRKDSMDAYEDLFDILKKDYKDLENIIVHFFVGSKDVARKLVSLGCYFTFGGVITFAREYDDIIDYLPADRIMLETDAPYVTPEPHRGKQNKPLFVKEVYKKMAELKNIKLKKLKKKMLENNKRVFGF